MSIEIALLMAVLLLLGNAFFVGAEFGLVAARRSAIELRASAGSRAARTTLGAMEKASLLLAGAQLGVTLCSLGLGAVGEPLIAHLLHDPFQSLGLSEHLLHPVSFVIALAVMVYFHVVIGEMVPKNLALAGPEKAALRLVPPLVLIVKALHPIVQGLNELAALSVRLLKIQPQGEVASTFTSDEVAGFVEESNREGLISDDKEQLLSGALRFDERTVRSVLLPMDTLVVVGTKVTPAAVEKLAGETGFSRFPVRTSHGKLVGYVHLKDMLSIDESLRKKPLSPALFRELTTVRPNDSLYGTLASMQRSGSHLAQVVTSRQKVLGVVALEDVLEELVGEIRDEAQNTTDS